MTDQPETKKRNARRDSPGRLIATRRTWDKIAAGLKTITGRLVLLVLIFAVMSVTAAAIAHFLFGHFADYETAMWWAFDHMLNVSAISNDAGIIERFLGVILAVTGLVVLAGILFSILGDAVTESLRKFAETNRPVTAKKHILFIGQSPNLSHFARLLTELQDRSDLYAEKVRELVVVSPDLPQEERRALETDLSVFVPKPHMIFGDLTDGDLYEQAAARDAAVIITTVVPTSELPPEQADFLTLQIASELEKHLQGTVPRPVINAVFTKGGNLDAAKAVLPASAYLFSSDRVTAGLVALYLINPLWATFTASIISRGEATIYLVEERALVGTKFSELCQHFRDALPIALLRPNPNMSEDTTAVEVLMPPGPNEEVLEGDEIAMLAKAIPTSEERHNRILVDPSQMTQDTRPVDNQDLAPNREIKQTKVLVIGFNVFIIPALLRELARSEPGQIHITCVSTLSVEIRKPFHEPLRDKIDIDHHVADLGNAELMQRMIEQVGPDVLIVTGDWHGSGSLAESDAQGLLNFLRIKQVLAGTGIRVMAIPSLPESVASLDSTDDAIIVATGRQLVYPFIASSLAQTHLIDIFGEIFDAKNDRMDVWRFDPADGQAVTFGSLYQACLSRGAMPLGVARSGETSVSLALHDQVLPGTDLLVILQRPPTATPANPTADTQMHK